MEKLKNTGKACAASLVTSGLVAYENRLNDWETYNQAVASRALSTIIFTWVFLSVHKKVKEALPEIPLKKPVGIVVTSAMVSATTYSVQLVCNDPEAVEAAKWAFCLGCLAFSVEDYSENLKGLYKKLTSNL